ncbi:MAG: HAD family phosphatase [Candidatus Rokubacteria bacterium]|nr:HAD family phosphatase [Candidatus Rokubacteria bacterium]
MSAPGSIRGILFDFGGVIHDMRWDVAEELEQAHRLPRGALFETLYRTPTWAALQCGRGDRQAWLEEAHRLLEARAGRPLPRLHDGWRAAQRVITENVALVRALRPRYRTAILSNADASLRARLRDGLGIEDLFDEIISSAEVGVAKPDPAIYRLAAERLGLPPEACVFVDDFEANVVAARHTGMSALHFRVDRGHDLRAQLAALGIAPAGEAPSGGRPAGVS